MTDCKELMEKMGTLANESALKIAAASTEKKNEALLLLARLIRENKASIFKANALDVEKARAENYPAAFIDRLTLTDSIIDTMAQGVEEIARLPDPVGSITSPKKQASGIDVAKMRVPLGVIGIIFESRPNVTIDAAALTLKAGNAVILRGGKEAFETNTYLGSLIQKALSETGLHAAAVQLVPTIDRAFVGEMITATQFIDVIIPRGGKGLIARLEKEAKVPMLKHLDGICHTYVDKDADIAMALSVVDNAKTQRVSPCNATETLLVHEKIARDFLPKIAAIFKTKNVEMRVTPAVKAIVSPLHIDTVDATADDWDTEYNAPVISIATVASLDEAIDFINTHGSKHTDAIITQTKERSDKFLRQVDSGSVMVNCSTRLADGFIYGLGAEIGISTGKLHARGPVGLEGLTSEKYVVYGHGEGRH